MVVAAGALVVAGAAMVVVLRATLTEGVHAAATQRADSLARQLASVRDGDSSSSRTATTSTQAVTVLVIDPPQGEPATNSSGMPPIHRPGDEAEDAPPAPVRLASHELRSPVTAIRQYAE